MSLIASLDRAKETALISEKMYIIFRGFFESYKKALISAGLPPEPQEKLFEILLKSVIEQTKDPFIFQSYHAKIVHPFNYYQFGLDFVRSSIDEKNSRIFGEENLEAMQQLLNRGENAILLANHQTEVDPQILSIILEKKYPKIAEEVIFVAGDRVLTDALAAPFSMGRNLLCIYSKRYIDQPPEKKHEKQLYNRRTMHKLKELLAEGGKCIYVAPSGGRDRPDKEGNVVVAPFDPQSVEMFKLFAKEALITSPKAKTHFYPLALATYPLLPPPPTIQTELGEMRLVSRGATFFSFGKAIDLNSFPGSDNPDRHEKRAACARFIWDLVNQDYQKITRK